MFTAIARIKYLNAGKQMQVRQKVVRYMLMNRERYEDVVANDCQVSWGQNHLEVYCKRMMFDGVWGDHLELQAIADAYGNDIHIYKRSTGVHRPYTIIKC